MGIVGGKSGRCVGEPEGPTGGGFPASYRMSGLTRLRCGASVAGDLISRRGAVQQRWRFWPSRVFPLLSGVRACARGSAMEIITQAITLPRLREMAESKFGDMVKAVVDVEKGIMAVDGELHADEEEQGNRTRGVENPQVRQRILEIVSRLVTR